MAEPVRCSHAASQQLAHDPPPAPCLTAPDFHYPALTVFIVVVKEVEKASFRINSTAKAICYMEIWRTEADDTENFIYAIARQD
ncbi:hypothetical protein [Paracoccus pacificus]|uniref:Uncharacterized protein n=1 Tax=Paracoccus pacificus TaxID=1463598 RepID=A0ABW4RAS6_9RHOB